MSTEITEDFFDPEKTTYIPYEEMSEERLTELARQGDKTAVEELLTRKFPTKEEK